MKKMKVYVKKKVVKTNEFLIALENTTFTITKLSPHIIKIEVHDKEDPTNDDSHTSLVMIPASLNSVFLTHETAPDFTGTQIKVIDDLPNEGE